MTTTVTFVTKDIIVMGSDSLGTASRPMIDPAKIYSHFDEEGNLKENKSDFNFWKDIFKKKEDVPYSHMAHMEKLFKLRSNVGVVTSGLVSIGDRTIKSLILEMAEDCKTKCENVVDKLINQIKPYYEAEFPKTRYQPVIEFIVAGWDSGDNKPKTYRIKFPGQIEPDLDQEYGIFFGGQYREIARLMHGTDAENMVKIENRHTMLLARFANDIKKLNPGQEVILPNLSSSRFHMFGPEDPEDSDSEKWRLSGFEANYADFSDQNAINCVYWLIDLMIKVQEFGDSMPTVGGEIHVAIIDKKEGFRFLSQESYNLQGYMTPKSKEASHDRT